MITPKRDSLLKQNYLAENPIVYNRKVKGQVPFLKALNYIVKIFLLKFSEIDYNVNGMGNILAIKHIMKIL